MKIKPVSSEGEPVEILKIAGEKERCDIEILCSGEAHRLTLNRSQVTIHDHSGEEIEYEKSLAQFESDVGMAIPCIRIKMWIETGLFIS